MIGVVGPGAVGHMLAFFLQRALPEEPLQMIGRGGPQAIDATLVWRQTAYSLHLAARAGTVPSLLFILVKSYQLQTALASVLPRLAPGGTVIVLGNGYLEPIVAPFRQAGVNWRKGSVSWGAKRDEHDRTIISDTGEIQWGGPGPVGPLEKKILEALREPYHLRWSDNSCDLRRLKWFYNTVLNTICGVYRLASNGLALQLHAAELETLGHEVHKLGLELWPDWNAPWEKIWTNLIALIHASRDNENSMARDLRLGRETEAAVLSGTISLAADSSRFPLLSALNARLKA